MIITLRTSKASWNAKKKIREVSFDELQVEIDTSIKAHLKWEREFEPVLKCTLVEYYDRVNEWLKDKNVAKTNILGLVKLLYCYVNSDQLPTFEKFLQLFEPETLTYNLDQISEVVTAVGKIVPKN